MQTNPAPAPSPGAPGPWRRGLGYLNWLFNPRHGLSAAAIYDLLGPASPTEHGMYLNLGYWREAETLDQASDALAQRVAEAAGMGPGDTVLDCGFGFADQDLLWARTLDLQRIVGLNVTASQVAVARRRVDQAGLSERIDLLVGSATAMPVAAASVDRVVALECAFHFDTRERFFREAFRVLRPGGTLALADILPTPALSRPWPRFQQRLSWGMTASRFAIPADNADTRPVYFSKLAMAGFEGIRVDSIREEVYAPVHRWLRAHPERLAPLHPVARQVARLALRLNPAGLYRGLDYVIAAARKPARGRLSPGATEADGRR